MPTLPPLTRDVMGRKRHEMELEVVEGFKLSGGWENTALSRAGEVLITGCVRQEL